MDGAHGVSVFPTLKVVAYISKGRLLPCPDPDGLSVKANNDYPHGLVDEQDLTAMTRLGRAQVRLV